MRRATGFGPTLPQFPPAFKAAQAVDFPPAAAYDTRIVTYSTKTGTGRHSAHLPGE